MKIDKFEGKYRFLSNFYLNPISFVDCDFPSAEHAYQAFKCVYQKDFDAILAAPTPGDAKRLGRRVMMHPGWDYMKLDVMKDICYTKFSEEPLLSMLLDTGDAELIEGNTWNDTYWGVCKGVGQNNLGKILMQIRKELKFLHKTSVV